ncbi:MAG: hypothetical protein ACRDHY_12080 [Anaerolineales bacterium]
MERDAIARVTKQVVKTFPEMGSVKPVVKAQTAPNGAEHYLLTFKGKAALPGGKEMIRIVRVVADERGQILRISTSR